MDVLADLLRIKVYREQKAERHLAIARVRFKQAEAELQSARHILKNFLTETARKEKAMYEDLCSRIVLLRDINSVQIDVQLSKERAEELTADVDAAVVARDTALAAEREAREQHRLAVRMREKFSEMMRVVQEERDFELARREEGELEEVAESRFAIANPTAVSEGANAEDRQSWEQQ